MTNRTYCDVCQTNIELRDSWHIKLEPRLAGPHSETIQWHEVCNGCVQKIKELKQ